MTITVLSLAERFIGLKEVKGSVDNPMILAMLKLDNEWPENDEVPWCSAFVNYICWLARKSRSKSLLARSWLKVGRHVYPHEATPGDIVVMSRGSGEQPGRENTTAPGHVGFFITFLAKERYIEVIDGNVKDQVQVSVYSVSRVLSIRRLV